MDTSTKTFARAADKARATWIDAGRPGKPQLWALAYFALGDDAVEAGSRYLKDYYAFTGPFAERIAAGLLTSPQAIAQFIRGYEEAGCDELVLLPAVPDLAQLEQLPSAYEWAKRLAQGPSLAISMTKHMLNSELNMDLVSAIEAEAQAQVLMGENHRRFYENFSADEITP